MIPRIFPDDNDKDDQPINLGSGDIQYKENTSPKDADKIKPQKLAKRGYAPMP